MAGKLVSFPFLLGHGPFSGAFAVSSDIGCTWNLFSIPITDPMDPCEWYLFPYTFTIKVNYINVGSYVSPMDSMG